MAGTISTGIPRNEIADVLLNGKFQNVITVAKTGRANFICSKYPSDSACIQAALDYIAGIGGGTLIVMRGYYTCTSSLSYLADNLTFLGQGNDTILDFSAIPNYKYITVSGSITTTNSLLASNAAAGDITITVATGGGSLFSAGDWIRIRSEAIFQPRPTETNSWTQRVGEMQQIASIAGDVITLRETLCGSYLTSDTATVDKMNMLENISFSDFSIVSTEAGNSGYGISVFNVVNVNIDRIYCKNVHDHCIYFLNIVRGHCNFCIAERAIKTELGYGFAVCNASREISGIGNHYINCRHGVTCGGDHTYGIQYNQTYIGNTQNYDEKNIGMFGMHPSYDGLSVIGNVCEGSGLGYFSGLNSTVVGNTVKNAKNVNGIKVGAGGSDILISDNTITTVNSDGILVSSMYSGITIENNQIRCPGSGNNGIYTQYNVSELTIQENVIKTDGCPVRVKNDGGTVSSSKIDIKNNTLTSTGICYGVSIRACDYNLDKIAVQGNTIHVNTGGGRGIDLSWTSSTGTNTSVVIDDNIIHGGDYGIDIAGSNGVHMCKNHVFSSTSGLYIVASASNYLVKDNEFVGCTTAISDSGTGSKLVVGNINDYVLLT